MFELTWYDSKRCNSAPDMISFGSRPSLYEYMIGPWGSVIRGKESYPTILRLIAARRPALGSVIPSVSSGAGPLPHPAKPSDLIACFRLPLLKIFTQLGFFFFFWKQTHASVSACWNLLPVLTASYTKILRTYTRTTCC